MKNFIIIVLIIILGGFGIYLFIKKPSTTPPVNNTQTQNNTPPPPATVEADKPEVVIGRSVEGRDIKAYHFGTGETEILFVGGIHGGYSWNTSLVTYDMIDYLKANPDVIPANVEVTVIPVLNPDGLKKVTGIDGVFTAVNVSTSQTVLTAGRFNANNVDLNRNFDCEWQAVGKWQTTDVSGGTKAFSEPETQAIKTYVETHKPDVAVVYYSALGGVFPSSCGSSVMPETTVLTKLYADASGYKEYKSFDFYPTTGDMVNWLAKNNIPAVSVLLSNHTDVEWDRNEKALKAVLQHYAK